MMRTVFLLPLILLVTVSFGQNSLFKGNVLDEKGNNISYATVAILDPTDSTLACYAVTNTNGGFEIKDIAPGKYILQSAFIGYKTFYREVIFPSAHPESPLQL